MFIWTADGNAVNDRFIISIDEFDTFAPDGKTAWRKIEYVRGVDVRETFITPQDADRLTD